MSEILLLRHALTDAVGVSIAGRAPAVHLNAKGRTQAEALAAALSHLPISRIFTSPLERARETAEPLAARRGISAIISPAITELDFGDWTGRSLAELDQLESWKQWNLFRSALRIPNGELMSEVQARMVGEIQRLNQEFPHDVIALISHADPIKAA